MQVKSRHARRKLRLECIHLTAAALMKELLLRRRQNRLRDILVRMTSAVTQCRAAVTLSSCRGLKVLEMTIAG